MRRKVGARPAVGSAATAVVAIIALLFVLAGCGPAAGGATGEATPVPDVTEAETSVGPTGPAEPSEVPPAREGRPAKSERITFEPKRVELPGGASAPVVPAATVDGVLKVPENVDHVGWWDGSAYAGDPFGSTVIAGHVDSSTQGIGFFARLLQIRVGDRVEVSAGKHAQRYRVVTVQTVARRALASDSRAFDQTGTHRLVLITCTGQFRRDRGGYDSNLVVIAKPIGLAR